MNGFATCLLNIAVLFLFVVGACRAELADAQGLQPKPNILIFMADDQIRSSIGCYGAHPSHTPSIDSFAKTAMRFTRCFTESSCCTPNRAVFLSGRYPLGNGAHANHSGFFDGVKSLPNYMKQLGYLACLVNKDGIRKPSDLYEWEVHITESDKLAPGATSAKSRRMRQTRFDELEAVIASANTRPFCILHASRQPHTPWLSTLPNGLDGYDASNWYMDSEFGRDLELLEKHGLTDSTIVIYCNDNEAHLPRTKYTLYDTGINVPCIVRWPGVTRPGTVTDAMIGFSDFLPTLVDIAGGERDPKWDGTSMVDLWRGNKDVHRSGLYLSYTGVSLGSDYERTPFPIRGFRTERFKYLRNLNHSVDHPKQEGMRVPPEELYDLRSDASEQHNLIGRREFEEVHRELSAKVDELMEQTNDLGIGSEMESLQRYPERRR